MKYIFYIITVYESNERLNNANNLKEKLEALGHTVEIVTAYYYKSCNVFEILYREGMEYADERKNLSKSQVACFLSHRAVWKKIATSTESTDVVHIILEDDVTIHSQHSLYDFNHAPTYDAIMLYRHPTQRDSKSARVSDGLLQYYDQWGLVAYTITPALAHELSTTIKKLIDPVDITLYRDVFPKKNVFIAEHNYFDTLGYYGGPVSSTYELKSLIWESC
jgi:GR25 family glycosyltransferase involved in LPS biosynthesis